MEITLKHNGTQYVNFAVAGLAAAGVPPAVIGAAHCARQDWRGS